MNTTLEAPVSLTSLSSVSPPGALSIRALSKEYHINGKPLSVLRDINLDIVPGEFVSIVGRSGCGKSTLLRLIVGLDTDYDGAIALDGERIRSTSLDRGIVFQEHSLLPWMTVEQNIAFAPPRGGEKAARGRSHRPGQSEGIRESLSPAALRRDGATGRHRPRPGQRAKGPAPR
jgi:ABC-type nitrate/sulfonate/bicarbonate transport system ATPase subunit